MSTILIIEDNPMNLEIAEELLKNAGHNIIKTNNAKEGVKLAKSKSPDIILMDLSLPEIDGLSATKMLKQDYITKNIPVIVFTASVMQADKEKAFGAGCAGFISKPIDVSSFASTVEKYINQAYKEFTITNAYENLSYLNQNTYNHINKIKQKKANCKWHKVLIIEDNPMNAEILKESLEQIGQSSVIANRGKEALEIVEKENFDLILLDIMMPEMSGFEVIEHLKENPKTKEIPVIFISALAETNDIVKGLDLGSYDYITKPFNIEELKAKIINILKIKDLQNQLITEKKKFDLIFKFSADGIVLINSGFEVISCNEQFAKWLNTTQEELIGKNFCKIICNQSTNSQPCHNNQNQSNCKKDECCQEICLNINGENKFIQINNSKINETLSGNEGFVLTLRDITAFKEIEKQKETFVATLTHDLKTPIRAEIRALELLLKGNFGKLTDEQTSIIQDTLCSSKYMFNMVNNLLCTYKNESGTITLQKDSIDINELAKNCYIELKQLVEDKKQQVIFDFKQKSIFLNVDIIEMKRVLTNLISNAINYNYENGTITIKTDISNNFGVISVIDNGKGIAQEDLKHLFNKYSSFAKKFRQVGTGLGLYVSKQIVEAHDGKIWVESKEGEGSSFSFSIPI